MGRALETRHVGYFLKGKCTVLDQGLGLSKPFLGQKPKDGGSVQLLEAIFQFVFIGAHLEGQVL